MQFSFPYIKFPQPDGTLAAKWSAGIEDAFDGNDFRLALRPEDYRPLWESRENRFLEVIGGSRPDYRPRRYLGFEATTIDNRANLYYALEDIAAGIDTSDLANPILLTLHDYIKIERADVLSLQGYTIRKGFLEIEQGEGGARAGDLYLVWAIRLVFKEQL